MMNSKLSTILSLAFFYLMVSDVPTANAITCPSLNCNLNYAMNDTNQCFSHSGDDPVTKIKVQKCKDPLEMCAV